jgi:hypothetical protein
MVNPFLIRRHLHTTGLSAAIRDPNAQASLGLTGLLLLQNSGSPRQGSLFGFCNALWEVMYC